MVSDSAAEGDKAKSQQEHAGLHAEIIAPFFSSVLCISSVDEALNAGHPPWCTDQRFEQILDRRDRQRIKAEREFRRLVTGEVSKTDIAAINGVGDAKNPDGTNVLKTR
jgi:hypothetical protein